MKPKTRHFSFTKNHKTMKKILLGAFFWLLLFVPAFAQQGRPVVGVTNIDASSVYLSAETLGNIVRLEMSKLEGYDVLDRYDVEYLLSQAGRKMDGCFGKLCLVDIGQILKADKMISGSVERYENKIVATLWMVDVATQTKEKTVVREYLDISEQVPTMLTFTLHELLGIPVDQQALSQLTAANQIENAMNNPYVDRLNLTGPRFGGTMYTGDLAGYLREPQSTGGFDIVPVMFQFGYQFEAQYLNEGRAQALFEFIPMISGMDQNLLIPSLTILNGFRDNKTGWEVAFGPSINFVQKTEGYFDDQGVWHREMDWDFANGPIPYEITTRIDSRADMTLNSGFLVAAGKSFRSGRLNIPVNVFVIPSRSGTRFGLSMGFNSKR